MVGLGGTGKCFTVKRLRETLGDFYSLYNVDNLQFEFPREGRLAPTDKICGYLLTPDNRKSGARSFLILDIPGERLETLQRFTDGNSTIAGEADLTRVADIGVALALADAIVVVIPAQQALDREGFIRRDIGDAEQRSPAERKRRVEELDRFIAGLDLLRNFMLPLRESARTAANPAALMSAITARLERIRTTRTLERTDAHLDLPALVLLSRADEYRDTLSGPQATDFDRNPVAHIALRRPALIHKFTSQFDHCR